MLEELKSCLNGDFQDAVEAMVTDPVLFDVQLLHRALFEVMGYRIFRQGSQILAYLQSGASKICLLNRGEKITIVKLILSSINQCPLSSILVMLNACHIQGSSCSSILLLVYSSCSMIVLLEVECSSCSMLCSLCSKLIFFQLLTIDGELLAEIICSRTNVQLMAIQEKYAQGK